MSPDLYANLINLDEKDQTNYGVLAIIGINEDHRGLRVFTHEEEEEINEARKLIGLECIKDYHKKVLYVYNHPEINNDFKLYYSGAKSIFNFSNGSGDKFWDDLLKNNTYKEILVNN